MACRRRGAALHHRAPRGRLVLPERRPPPLLLLLLEALKSDARCLSFHSSTSSARSHAAGLLVPSWPQASNPSCRTDKISPPSGPAAAALVEAKSSETTSDGWTMTPMRGTIEVSSHARCPSACRRPVHPSGGRIPDRQGPRRVVDGADVAHRRRAPVFAIFTRLPTLIFRLAASPHLVVFRTRFPMPSACSMNLLGLQPSRARRGPPGPTA